VSYRDTLLTLAGTVETSVVALWGRLELGEISPTAFVELAAVTIARGNARATTLADVALATTISAQLGRTVLPMGNLLDVAGDVDRLRGATTTVVELGTVGRAARLARSEPLTAAATAYSSGIRESPYVTGWIRQTSGDACPLCTGWANGDVMPDTVAMNTHKGCSCIPVPVTTT
jgi:hypothetical protein